MNELALFAGAGGGILGGKLLGWRTICAVEWESYPASVLCARQNEGLLPPFPIWDDIRTFDGRPWRGITQVISGGFPCQDISAAGKGDGLDGERSSMWFEMARVVGEIRPRFVFVENSPMLTSRGGVRVIADLTSLGYDCRWTVMGAADVGAPHQRDRIWIVARQRHILPHPQHDWNGWGEQQSQSLTQATSAHSHANRKHDALRGNSQDYEEGLAERGVHARGSVSGSGERCEAIARQSPDDAYPERMGWQKRPIVQGVDGLQDKANILGDLCEAQPRNPHEMGDTQGTGFPPRPDRQGQEQSWGTSIGASQWWEIEPDVGRVADGVAARVDRLKAIGNGQVPLCAASAWRLLTQDWDVI